MARCCDYYVDKGSKYFCILKGESGDGEISEKTYKDFCRYADKNCPILKYYEKERR